MSSYSDFGFDSASTSGTSGPAIKEFPATAEAFPEFIIKHFALIHPPLESLSGVPFECVICASPDKTVIDCSLARKCASSTYPCDGLPCQCKPASFSICYECIVSTLWSSTSSILKDQKRFRAKCPFCKASYCHLDIVYYTTKTDSTSSSGSTGSSRRRRKTTKNVPSLQGFD